MGSRVAGRPTGSHQWGCEDIWSGAGRRAGGCSGSHSAHRRSPVRPAGPTHKHTQKQAFILNRFIIENF